MLSKLTSTKLSSYGTVSTLTEIGLKTNNDGTLTLDATKLSAVLASDPDGVEALFNPGQSSSNPLLTITSALGATTPGTYTITNVTAQNGATSASALIDGTAALGSGNTLIAGYGTPSYGLAFTTKGAVSSATITVDLGLFGAVKAIQSQLEAASTGTITLLQSSLDKTAGTIADAETKLDTDSAAYQAQLTTQFTAMQSAVTSYKSIQSYLTQQVALWTKSDS
jgi:flagellar hook-associated protein 2